ncbi:MULTISPECIES: rodlin [unclassified Streptomyces]|uniref:rodlin n=1 Tax=unclassified Streptomyces TaxID=2593676 RepID=UPI00345488F1
MKKLWATAALAATLAGVTAATAPQALAHGDGDGTWSASGNGAKSEFGNSATFGEQSPQLSLVQGSLNKPCIGLPAKADIQNIVALVNVGVQDIPILSSPQYQQCAENSTQAKGDDSLSHVLDDISVLAENG